VLVVDCTAKYVISLLSGHLGGANELTLRIAEILKAQPIITTASDNLGLLAPDLIAKQNHLVIEDMKKAKDITGLLVAGEKIAFIDERNNIILPPGYTTDVEDSVGLVIVTDTLKPEVKGSNSVLRLIRKDIVLGIGCRKDYDAEKMFFIVAQVLKDRNIDIRAVRSIGTVEVKKEEKAIISLSQKLGCDLQIFTINQIEKIQHKYEGSDFVQKTIGVRAVCEPCVELAGGTLLTDKIACEGMTICVGRLEVD
jgi:cobalt-precorrin 5A hydrolase